MGLKCEAGHSPEMVHHRLKSDQNGIEMNEKEMRGSLLPPVKIRPKWD